MRAIAVDDEVLMLGALVKAISASPDIKEVTKFSDCTCVYTTLQVTLP